MAVASVQFFAPPPMYVHFDSGNTFARFGSIADAVVTFTNVTPDDLRRWADELQAAIDAHQAEDVAA